MQRLFSSNAYRAKFHRKKARVQSLALVCCPPSRLRFHAPRKTRQAFEKFVADVSMYLAEGKKVEIDFRQVTRLYPCGVLLLMGCVDHWIGKYKGMLSARYPKDDLAEQMLQHVEVLQKLGLPPRKTVEHQDVKRWYYLAGDDVNPAPFTSFMDEVAELVGEVAQAGLFECISEAITNVKHHAYRADGPAPWWAFCTASARKIFVAVHDRGASIPGTLINKTTIPETVKRRLLRRNIDGDLITAAVGGRSRTQLEYRGKGLPDMYKYTKVNSQSELGIYSRQGYFNYVPHLSIQEQHGEIRYPVEGTLIMWMISLDGGQDD